MFKKHGDTDYIGQYGSLYSMEQLTRGRVRLIFGKYLKEHDKDYNLRIIQYEGAPPVRKIMIVTLAVLLVGAFAAGNLYAGDSAPAKSCPGATTAVNATSAADAKAVTASAGCQHAVRAGCKMTPEECAKLCDKKCDKDSKCEFTTFSVKGMTCGGCENSIKTALTKVDGVCKVISISHKDGVAKVCYDAAKTSSDALATVISNKGFGAEVMLASAITDAKKAGCKSAGTARCCKTKAKAKIEGTGKGPQ